MKVRILTAGLIILLSSTIALAQGRGRRDDPNAQGSGDRRPSYTVTYSADTLTLDFNVPITSQNEYGSCNLKPYRTAVKGPVCEVRGVNAASFTKFQAVVTVGERFEPRYVESGVVAAISRATSRRYVKRN